MTTNSGTIHDALAKVCPILDGTELGRRGDNSTIRWRPAPEATEQQRAAAQAIVDGWDWSEAAEVAREEAANPERTAVRRALAAIEADAAAWEAIAGTATPAQTRSAMTKLASHLVKIARYVGKL